MQCFHLHLLPAQLAASIVKVENDTALLQLLDEEFIPLLRSNI